jgi:hypothetical protein
MAATYFFEENMTLSLGLIEYEGFEILIIFKWPCTNEIRARLLKRLVRRRLLLCEKVKVKDEQWY